MGPKGRWVEVQIRSQRMNEIAEKGYAAHYKYKNELSEDDGLDVWLNKLQETLEHSEVNAIDFVEEFKLSLYAKEIFVFSPKGDLYSLAKGATALDFAFHVHTQIGLRTRGAKVNGKLVPLSFELSSGDQVEIITSEKTKPTANWLNYAITGRAISKIKSSLKEEQKQIAEEGKVVLQRKLRAQKIPFNEKTINELVRYFKLKTSLDLFYRIGAGIIDNSRLKSFAASRSNAFMNFFKNRIRRPQNNQELNKEELTVKYDQLVFGKDEEKLDYKVSPCCNPIPGDDVFGFLTINDGIKVHKTTCPNALQMQSNYSYRILKAKWIDSTQREFQATLRISGIDTFGMVNNLTKVVSNNLHIDMKSVHFDTDDGTFTGTIVVIVKNKSILDNLVKNIKKISGIDKVSRV
jgi:GTP pyrophosphokinase